MIAQRVGLSALRRGAAIRPNVAFTQNVPRLAVASNLSTSTPSRNVAVVTEKLSPDQEETILAAQRKLRPISPHLQIYRPEQTWFGASIWTRITGGALAGTLYGYSIVYLASPLLGWHIESSALVEAFAGLGALSKGTIKSVIAWPFVYHLFNGIRHLTYDMTWGFSKPTISKVATGITISSTVVALGLGFLW